MPPDLGLSRGIARGAGTLSGLESAHVTEQGQGVVHDKFSQKGFPLSISGGFCPPRPPAKFQMPAARGKTSLHARDW